MKMEELRFDENGLIPVVVQDAGSKEVLTLAYMNEESLEMSIDTRETWFYSRSRQELWHKGGTSGNTQRIVELRYDCDQDALVALVEPQGPACHTGSFSCFGESLLDAGETIGKGRSVLEDAEKFDDGKVLIEEKKVDNDEQRFAILAKLESLIAEREKERPEGAYTTYLFEEGVDKILKKVGEEASEVIIAAKNRDPGELSWEAADLIYHLLVLLEEQKLPLDDVLSTLQQRHLKKEDPS